MAPDTHNPFADIDVGTMRELHRYDQPEWYERPLGRLSANIDPAPPASSRSSSS